MPVTLDEVKEHLNLEGVTGQDQYLEQLLLPAAVRAVEKSIRCSIGDLSEADLSLARQAVLLTIGTWFENRDGATTDARSLPAEIPLSLTWITDLLRRWDDGSDETPA